MKLRNKINWIFLILALTFGGFIINSQFPQILETVTIGREGVIYYVDYKQPDQGTSSLGSLRSYIDTIGTVKKATIVLPHSGTDTFTTYTLAVPITITSNITIRIDHGALLTKSGTGSIFFGGPFENPSNGQCFIGFAAGDVTGLKEARPEWWQTNTTPGTTDMRLAVQSAIKSGAVDIYTDGEIYLLNSITSGSGAGGDVNLWINTSNINLWGVRGKTIFRSASAQAAFAIWKNSSIYTYETATSYLFNAAIRGSNSVTISTPAQAANFTIGDIVYLKGAALAQPGQFKGDTNIVTSVNATTGVIGLACGLSWSYPGGTASLAVVNDDTLMNISIDGIIFEHTGQAILGAQLDKLSVRNNQFKAIGTWNQFQFNQVHNFSFEDNVIYNLTGSSGAALDPSRNSSRLIITRNKIFSQSSGIGVGEAASDFKIVDNQVFVDDKVGTGLAIAVGVASNAIISRNQVTYNTTVNSNSAIYDSNGGASEQVIISENTILTNSDCYPIKTGSEGTVVWGNSIRGLTNGIYASGLHNVVSNNVIIITGNGYGIILLNDGHNSIIQGNVIKVTVASTLHGILVPDNGMQVRGPVIVGNKISGFYYDIAVSNFTNEPGAIIENNVTDGYTTKLVLKNGGKSAAIVTGNAITHGLSVTPNRVSVIAAESGPTDVYTTTVDGTNIVVNFGGGGSKTFYWEASFTP